jgi:hypothetical protein
MTSNAVLIDEPAYLLPKRRLAKFACDSRKKRAILMSRNRVDRDREGKQNNSAVLENGIGHTRVLVDPSSVLATLAITVPNCSETSTISCDWHAALRVVRTTTSRTVSSLKISNKTI